MTPSWIPGVRAAVMGLPAVRTSACGRLDVGGCEFVIRYAPLSEKLS